MEEKPLWEGSGSKGDFGSEGCWLCMTGFVAPVVLDSTWYAISLRAPRALILVPPPLGDALALALYARAMGEKPLKGRDIEGMPKRG